MYRTIDPQHEPQPRECQDGCEQWDHECRCDDEQFMDLLKICKKLENRIKELEGGV